MPGKDGDGLILCKSQLNIIHCCSLLMFSKKQREMFKKIQSTMEHMGPGITVIFILFLTVLTVHVSSELTVFLFCFLSVVLHFFSG